MRQQNKWLDENKETKPFIKDSIYRSEYDHPNSQHHIVNGKSAQLQVHYPDSSNDPANQKAHLSLNGYYDK